MRMSHVAATPAVRIHIRFGRSMPKGWRRRATMKRIAALQSHNSDPLAISTRPNRIRKKGVYSTKLACARIRVAMTLLPPWPIETLWRRLIWLTRNPSQTLSSAAAPAMVRGIGMVIGGGLPLRRSQLEWARRRLQHYDLSLQHPQPKSEH